MPLPAPILMPPREVERALLHDIAIDVPLPGVWVRVATDADGIAEEGR